MKVFGNYEKGGSGQGGFTLVEALISVAVLGILTMVIANVISQVSQAAIAQKAGGRMMTNLNIAGNQIIDDLRSASRNNALSPQSFRFRGRDGDGKFEKTTSVPHDDLGITDGTDVDDMHFHNLYSNLELDAHMGGLGTKCSSKAGDCSGSERVRNCYYLCVPGSGCTYSVLGGEMGVMKRRDRHTHNETDDGVVAPPLNIDITNNEGANPMAFNVDYLSFRYYDNETGTWSNTWDSDDEGGAFPDAVEFAMRGYDPGGDIPPEWYIGMVSLSPNPNT